MKHLVVSIAAVCSLVSTLAITGAAQQCSPQMKNQATPVKAFRIINTAESRYHHSKQRYADLSELMSSEEIKSALASAPNHGRTGQQDVLGTVDDPIQGYTVHFVVSRDGSSYSATATVPNGPCQGIGVTTDERGLIYLMDVLH